MICFCFVREFDWQFTSKWFFGGK